MALDGLLGTNVLLRNTAQSIGVARIFSGVHFFLQKVDDLFLIAALKTD